MMRRRINRIAAIAPVAMSFAAFGLVLIAVATGFERGYPDEGAAAHTFQLLIGAEIPVIAVFLGTVERGRAGRPWAVLAVQAGALCLALGSVAYFRL